MKALLVDDEYNVRDVIRYFGQWERLEITEIWEAENGEQAQSIIEKERPEIIFTDIKMPKVNGLQLMDWLNESGYPGKVIVVSGYDDYTFMRKAIQCASYDYLLKPIEADVLNTVLEGAVQAWKTEHGERARTSTFAEEGRKIHFDRLITAAADGQPWDWEELASYLPKAEAYDVHVLYFYHTAHFHSYIHQLADEMASREWGSAFVLLNDSHTAVVISAAGCWTGVEQWIRTHTDMPVRSVQGDTIPSVSAFPQSYQSAKREMEQQNYRTIHQVGELDDSRRMEDIVQYLKEHYTEEFCLEKLSSRFFLSREHISRRFKQEQGVNISHYLIHLRIEQAKKLLRETNEKIVSIALQIGYQNEKYFSKLFKKVVGITPAQYRESNGKPDNS